MLARLSNFSRETDNWKGDGRREGVTHGTIIGNAPGITQELVDESQEVVLTVRSPSTSRRLWLSQGGGQELSEGISSILCEQDSLNRGT